MSTQNRSSARVLRDMAKHDKEQKDATENTRETEQNRAAGRSTSDSDSAESRPTTTSPSEETDPVTDETPGGLAGANQKEVVESSTKATAIVKPVKESVREFAVCPRCHERRYKPEQVGTTVACINCRANVVLT